MPLLPLQVLVSVVALTETCLEWDDPVGANAGFAFFSSLVTAIFDGGLGGEDRWFYEDFILTRLLPLCFLSPARPQFRLTDAQYILALNEAANCLHSINTTKVIVHKHAGPSLIWIRMNPVV